jgi:hypothetical protein
MNLLQAVYLARKNNKMIRRAAWPEGVALFINPKNGVLSYIEAQKMKNIRDQLGAPDTILALDWVVLEHYGESMNQGRN